MKVFLTDGRGIVAIVLVIGLGFIAITIVFNKML
jgi:hypothetical protein